VLCGSLLAIFTLIRALRPLGIEVGYVDVLLAALFISGAPRG
jgi:hypothetical protein